MRRSDVGLAALRSGLTRFGRYLRRGTAAYGVLLIALLLTVIAWYYVRQTVEVQNRARFEESTQATQEALERRTKAYLDAMFGARGLFYASDSVTQEDWSDYVKGIEPASRFEGLQALGYAQRVDPEDRESFMRKSRDEGLPGMRPDLDPGGERSAYFPLTYVAPIGEANQSMLDYDFYAEDAHREPMDLARDSGEPRATNMVYVLSEAHPDDIANLALRRGFVVYLPIYQEREPLGSVGERRRALRGFIVGSFVSDELLDGIFKGSFDPAIDFEAYDGGSIASSPLLYDRDGIRRDEKKRNSFLFFKETQIRVAGRVWTLYFTTLPAFEEGAESNLPPFVLASGLMLSLLIFGITLMVVRSRSRAEIYSEDLEVANKELESFYNSVEQELGTARSIQHALLPKDLPKLDGWKIAYHYQPAREVGGDFYDFLPLDGGRIGLVIGDVSGKGIAAALVMANTQSVLRAIARRGNIAPGRVLAEANEVLYAYIPAGTFVTCFYGVLDPESGRLLYANAGHDPPYMQRAGDAQELIARGMPLGLMPGMPYEEKEADLAAGDDLLFYSDGLVEAHDSEGEMFGFPRLRDLVMVQSAGSGEELVDFLLAELTRFTGEDSEQEDDITLVTLERSRAGIKDRKTQVQPYATDSDGDRRALADFTLPSEPGNERLAMEKVAEAVNELGLSGRRLDRLKTAVAEATMNAMEHGNRYDPKVPVRIQIWLLKERLLVRIIDRGSGPLPSPTAIGPDLQAKLGGTQTARGWGLFLIERMVDEVRVSGNPDHHTVELVMRLEAGKDAS
ncbi:MAG: Serine phosphatase RsbU, regulator of sigma subunit [uncultured Rubrobacteraceae bacterium]|uniref:Serine phosphatase RsbU, regulator of sigma subunit n=1 Tax=uncultured Rubrobacteraceae bacterium TaxID=349277 RepID=A0A6J4R7G0_9ACTN|nr:MAG: Serine phosphatase RsbU, regulator of sigma subunit [uncultured Rubrobacteraceae bacterium]